MARPGITYEQVEAVCNQLDREGTKPNQRNVRAELGSGSNATILRYIAQWVANNVPVKSDFEIPVNILTVIKNSMLEAIENSAIELTQQLSDKQQALDEAIGLIEVSENKVLQIQAEFDEYKLTSEKNILEFEKQLAASTKQTEDLNESVVNLNSKLDDSLKAQELARTETAKSQMQVERADRATNKAEKQVLDLTDKLNSVNKLLVEAEKDSATSNAKSLEQTKAIERLDNELSNATNSANTLQAKYDSLLERYELAVKIEPVVEEQAKSIKRLELELSDSKKRYDAILTKNEKLTKSEASALAKLEKNK